ncbi:phosphatase PAP2 family protein [Paenibacillus eucommiae]|uniref:Undecaprenyl-diphosphatase n=1 Tax=Paenibacillus eucommiae TaxID=1355755 RepID=A0ABS4J470_9BACL|nr:phosphatase PAP2 family protein [Paenibacillus eucommiae]MBP1993599.1 undecaprenyl-diphosphatase [Paenibacillus eucommiae]
MSKVVRWLQKRENRVFYWVNQRIRHSFLDFFFNKLTHLGGASITIGVSLILCLFGSGTLRLVGFQSLLALIISHIPVALFKKKYPRLRPYLVLPETRTGKNPLADHSFPSGHTTAIFSVTVPLAVAFPLWGMILLPIAFLVGISRIYLGLHYPSDCLAGCLIGSATALTTVAWV